MNVEATTATSNTVDLEFEPRLRYRAAGWVRANTAFAGSQHKWFARQLRKSAYPVQKGYRQLMEAYGGEPVGIECRHTDRQHWGFVAPETGIPGQYRVQYFDEDGFSGHSVFSNLEEAVETMLRDGYRIVDVGALDKTAATPRWARGVQVATLRQQCQEGLITFPKMVEAMRAL
jgi:hypothetical protein